MNNSNTTDIKPGQIEKTLLELKELEEKLQGVKDILRHFKVKSDRLDQLKTAYKELKEQMNGEKDRIEQGFLEDTDYETAKNDEVTLKPQIRDKKTEMRQLMTHVNPNQQLSTLEYNIKGEALKIQVERTVKVYINGKEAK